MNPNLIIGEVISSALGVRHRRGHHHHYPFDVIAGGHPWWLNGGTLMAALGIAWGILDTANAASAPSQSRPFTAASSGRPSAADTTTAAQKAAPMPAEPTVPIEVARVIRLTVSAARADGALSEAEQEAIRTRARAVGAEPLVDAELKTPTPLARLVAGVPAASRNELYTLAFAIVRADGLVAGAERIYLAQLAHALGLSADESDALERTASERLTAAAPAREPPVPATATQSASAKSTTDAVIEEHPATTPDVS